MEALVLPDLAGRSDAELMAMSGREFADAMLDKAARWGADMLHRAHYDLEELAPDERNRRLIQWNLVHAYLEWWLGVVPPSQQIVGLDDGAIGIKVRLSQQIIDEVKHQRVFSRIAQRLGSHTRFEKFTPGPSTRNMYEMTALERPLDIAASLQCTGEAVLMHTLGPEDSVVTAGLAHHPEIAAEIARDVVPEEPRHVAIGRDLVTQQATTPDIRRHLARIQDEKLQALADHYQIDLELLGAHRKKPVPVIGG